MRGATLTVLALALALAVSVVYADENVDTWLKTLNPEVANIMFGTNDLSRGGTTAPSAALKLPLLWCWA